MPLVALPDVLSRIFVPCQDSEINAKLLDIMKSLFQNFEIALCGLITSILVALADVAIASMTGVDIFTFSIWIFVPIGALLTGCAAASGYYFGAIYFNKQANGSLLVQMVLIAGVTQFLIYWVGYTTTVLDDGIKVADFVSFSQYMDIILTKAHYRVGRGFKDTGEVGTMGYWIAIIQFIGFLIGGVLVYFNLKIKPVCGACKLYLRPLAKKIKNFSDSSAASDYYDRLTTLPTGCSDFVELIKSETKATEITQGSFQITTLLLGCPKCKTQMIQENVQVCNGKEWKNISKLDRNITIPQGIDLSPIFRG